MSMDLGRIDSMTTARRRRLEAAGIRTVQDLAQINVGELARRVNIPLAPLRDFKHKAATLVLLDAVHDMGKTLRSIGPASIPVLAGVAIEVLLKAAGDVLRRGMDQPAVQTNHPSAAHEVPGTIPPASKTQAESGPIVAFDSSGTKRQEIASTTLLAKVDRHGLTTNAG